MVKKHVASNLNEIANLLDNQAENHLARAEVVKGIKAKNGFIEYSRGLSAGAEIIRNTVLENGTNAGSSNFLSQASMPRSVGRPAKSQKGTKSAAKAASQQTGEVKRGPGRPRKIVTADEQHSRQVAAQQQIAAPDETQPVKRGPGRPRKNAISSVMAISKADQRTAKTRSDKQQLEAPMPNITKDAMTLVGELRKFRKPVGNTSLRNTLGWQENRYYKARDILLGFGAASLGRGRGGSVMLNADKAKHMHA
jgi:hypothetical protein